MTDLPLLRGGVRGKGPKPTNPPPRQVTAHPPFIRTQDVIDTACRVFGVTFTELSDSHKPRIATFRHVTVDALILFSRCSNKEAAGEMGISCMPVKQRGKARDPNFRQMCAEMLQEALWPDIRRQEKTEA